MNENFVFYRYPNTEKYTVLRQNTSMPETLYSYDQLDGKSGFVFAPFKVTAKCPIMILRPDTIEQHTLEKDIDFDKSIFETHDVENERNKYGCIFRQFHNMLTNKRFKKIVLSRISHERAVIEIDPTKLFKRACQLYPHMFIALVSMKQCGTWLMATPEILVESIGKRWHTMSVAGTMHINVSIDTDENLSIRKKVGDINEWNHKNIQEQNYVSQYILKCLQHAGTNINKTGPYTLRAGMIKHLTTDFTFNLESKYTIGKLINELHPTPAVCGIPKTKTYEYILAKEGYNRKYYSGFTGILNSNEGTHLYVTLRCMQIQKHEYILYSGGGLLADSEEDKEWLETENKMETMRKCLAIKRM